MLTTKFEKFLKSKKIVAKFGKSETGGTLSQYVSGGFAHTGIVHGYNIRVCNDYYSVVVCNEKDQQLKFECDNENQIKAILTTVII